MYRFFIDLKSNDSIRIDLRKKQIDLKQIKKKKIIFLKFMSVLPVAYYCQAKHI